VPCLSLSLNLCGEEEGEALETQRILYIVPVVDDGYDFGCCFFEEKGSRISIVSLHSILQRIIRAYLGGPTPTSSLTQSNLTLKHLLSNLQASD